MDINKIYNQDCLIGLKTLPDNCIDCCVTSPPYYGLRDYGTATWEGGEIDCDHIAKHNKHGGERADRDQTSQIFQYNTSCDKCGAIRIDNQIGLEETPEQYIQKLVEVFREVKRVLKKEGTLFLNIGDSYWGSGRGNNPNGKQGTNKGTCFELPPNARHATSYGTSGKEPEDYPENDCLSENLCDACQQDYPNHKSHNDSLHVPKQAALLFSQIREYMEASRDHLPTSDFLLLTQTLQSYFSIQNLRHLSSLSLSQLDVFLQSSFDEFYLQFLALCLPISNQDALIQLSQETLKNYVLDFAHKLHRELLETSRCNDDSVLFSEQQAQSNQYISRYCSKCGKFSSYLLTNIKPQSYNNGLIKPKDLIGIPWMLAFALRADGWYLRQDIIWHKPNPMPESVTDRCTKSHEYIFLLSKSAKYYYDAEAISEDSVDPESYTGRRERSAPTMAKFDIRHLKNSGSIQENGKLTSGQIYEKRNKRSVWTVTTKAYSDTHFATFPEDLIVDMIKAGCPENRIVLDPFMGAGTTALVASKLNRNYIGFELNEKYIKIANKRLYNHLGMFNKAI